jgi:hypothetical protein
LTCISCRTGWANLKENCTIKDILLGRCFIFIYPSIFFYSLYN